MRTDCFSWTYGVCFWLLILCLGAGFLKGDVKQGRGNDEKRRGV